MQTFVYRIFDSHGILLYVGRTQNLKARMSRHKSLSAWHSRMNRFTTVAYATREMASLAEREAIRVENPLHNGGKNLPSNSLIEKSVLLSPIEWRALRIISAKSNEKTSAGKIGGDIIQKELRRLKLI